MGNRANDMGSLLMDNTELPAAEQRMLTAMLGAREAGRSRVRVPLRCWRVARRLQRRNLLVMRGRRAELTSDGWWAAIGRRAQRPHRV